MVRKSTTGEVPPRLVSDTGAPTVVAAATSATTLAAGNDARVYLSVFNDSTAILYLLWGSGTPSATNFTIKIPAQGFYELPTGPTTSGNLTTVWVGAIRGVWAAVNGNAYVTEAT